MIYYLAKPIGTWMFDKKDIILLIRAEGEKSIVQFFEFYECLPTESDPFQLVVKSKRPPKHKKIEKNQIIASKNFDLSLIFSKKILKYKNGDHVTIWPINVRLKNIISHRSKKYPLMGLTSFEFDSDDDAKLWFEMENL